MYILEHLSPIYFTIFREAIKAIISISTLAAKIEGERPAQTALDLDSIMIKPLPPLLVAEFQAVAEKIPS